MSSEVSIIDKEVFEQSIDSSMGFIDGIISEINVNGLTGKVHNSVNLLAEKFTTLSEKFNMLEEILDEAEKRCNPSTDAPKDELVVEKDGLIMPLTVDFEDDRSCRPFIDLRDGKATIFYSETISTSNENADDYIRNCYDRIYKKWVNLGLKPDLLIREHAEIQFYEAVIDLKEEEDVILASAIVPTELLISMHGQFMRNNFELGNCVLRYNF